jgi:EAL domain-containing protein (putative c-di-GMP-specific phosphodiesterase class I)
MLGLRSVAEGVEEPDQEAQLKLLGCTSAQGYLFGYPVGADAVSEMLGQGARSRRAAG